MPTNINQETLQGTWDNLGVNGASSKAYTSSKGRRKPQLVKNVDKPEMSRWHCLSTYIAYEHIEKFLKVNASWIKHWAYTLHDKDVTENGEPKEPHTHILLYTFSAKTSSSVRKKFDSYSKQIALKEVADGKANAVPQNTLGQVCHEPVYMYRYQLHLDDPEKYQYPKEARKVSDVYYWREFEGTDCRNSNIALEIFDSIQGGMSTRDLLVNYGCEFAHNQRNYHALAEQDSIQTAFIQRSVDDFQQLITDVILDEVEKAPFSMQSRKDFIEIYKYVAKQIKIEYGYNLVPDERTKL